LSSFNLFKSVGVSFLRRGFTGEEEEEVEEEDENKKLNKKKPFFLPPEEKKLSFFVSFVGDVKKRPKWEKKKQRQKWRPSPS